MVWGSFLLRGFLYFCSHGIVHTGCLAGHVWLLAVSAVSAFLAWFVSTHLDLLVASCHFCLFWVAGRAGHAHVQATYNHGPLLLAISHHPNQLTS